MLHEKDIQQALSPMKDFEDMRSRFRVAFAYPFVVEAYNFSLPELEHYTRRLLGGDACRRYDEYAGQLAGTLAALNAAEAQHVVDLVGRVETIEKLEALSAMSGVSGVDILSLLKFLVYWVMPAEKYLSTLIQDVPELMNAVKTLREAGVRTNLDILQRGNHAAGRKALAEACGLPQAVVDELVNRADFSRLPWASKATISNIIGAGYGSLAKLANADPEQLYADFFRYGASIGKNLKLGNEIESSQRIAKNRAPVGRGMKRKTLSPKF